MLTDSLSELRKERLRNVAAFLKSRELSGSELDRLVRGRVGDVQSILLTSSAVHGFANALSDVDLVCVVASESTTHQMASQLFERNNHIEYTVLEHADIIQALAALRTIGRVAVPEAVAQMRAWNHQHAIRIKYLERVINGVTLENEFPYLEWLPDLSASWKWMSVGASMQSAVLAAVAGIAGETRGPLAYAVTSLFHVMDACLSHHGDVQANRKWCLLRWQRFQTEHTLVGNSMGLVEAILELQETISGALSKGVASAEFGLEVYARTISICGHFVSDAVVPLARRRDVDDAMLTFLPGAVLHRYKNGCYQLESKGGRLERSLDLSLSTLRNWTQQDAEMLLRRLRSNQIEIDLRMQSAS